MFNKKAVLFRFWAELFAIGLLIIGFIFSLTTIGSSVMSYILIFLWGLMFGRLWYKLRKTFRLPLFIILVAFLVGYLVATMIHNYGRPLFLTIIYIIGIIISYKFHYTKKFKMFDF